MTKIAARLPRPVVDRVKRVIAAPFAWNLHALAVIYGTDKAPGSHGYTRYYSRFIKRRSVRYMLENAIEDLHTAYSPGFEGGPPGTPGTSIELLKELMHRTQASSGARDIAELHVFNDIAFIRKAEDSPS